MYSHLLHWQWYVTHTQTDNSFYCNKLLFQDEPPKLFQTLKDLKHNLQSLFVSSEQYKITYRKHVQHFLQGIYELCSKPYDTMKSDMSQSLSYVIVSFKKDETLFLELIYIYTY